MKNCILILAKIAIFSLLLVLPAAAQPKPVAPETLAAAREAVTNMQIINLIIAGGKAGFATPESQKNLTKQQRAKLPALYEAEVKAASARIIDRLAKAQAQKFDREQINNILAATKGPYYQAVLASSYNGKPSPPESELTPAETEIFGRIGTTVYFKSFQNYVLDDGGNLQRDISTLLKRAYAKVK